jgi:N6-adenosine-specific RNA methylase IME4
VETPNRTLLAIGDEGVTTYNAGHAVVPDDSQIPRVVDADGAHPASRYDMCMEQVRVRLKRGGREMVEVGQWLNEAYKACQQEHPGEWSQRIVADTGLSLQTVDLYRRVSDLADRYQITLSLPPSLQFRLCRRDVPKWLLDGLESGEIQPTEAAVLELIDPRPAVALPKPKPPQGIYRCLVIDPPWPMEKIHRDLHPRGDQQMPYATLSLDELAGPFLSAKRVQDMAAPDGCHLYPWTTHHFVPDALRLLEGWGFRYHCMFAWIKPGGMTPFYWQYDWEPCLFGTMGSLPLQQNAIGLKLSIDARRGAHSEKPEAFYERVRQASPGPRVELFARQPHVGFESWGDEVASSAPDREAQHA